MLIQFRKRDLMQGWQGEYTYDEGLAAHLHLRTKSVSFNLTFRVLVFGILKGQISDGENGIPETAAVSATISRSGAVRFRKIYPRTWAAQDDSGELTVFDARRSVVHYSGKFEGPSKLSGAWEIRSERRVVNELEYELPRVTGKWHAEQVSPEV